jgi:hypothetical protein
MDSEIFDEIKWSIGGLIESSSADEEYEWIFEATGKKGDETIEGRAVYYGEDTSSLVQMA